MQKQAGRKMKPKKMPSFLPRRCLLWKLVKHAVSRASLRKLMNANADHEVQLHAEGDLIPGSCGVIVYGEFVPLTTGFLVDSAVPYYVPVVENHGFLLGEFSKLDDLSIILEDESSYRYSNCENYSITRTEFGKFGNLSFALGRYCKNL